MVGLFTFCTIISCLEEVFLIFFQLCLYKFLVITQTSMTDRYLIIISCVILLYVICKTWLAVLVGIGSASLPQTTARRWWLPQTRFRDHQHLAKCTWNCCTAKWKLIKCTIWLTCMQCNGTTRVLCHAPWGKWAVQVCRPYLRHRPSSQRALTMLWARPHTALG